MTDNARNQARAQVVSIVEMVAALRVDYDRLEELRDTRDSQGSVISGTMRAQDLIPAFMDELRERAPVEYAQLIVNNVFPAHAQEDEDSKWWHDEAPSLLECLFDELEGCAPRGLYFGAHPGDGSDFGFWMTEDDAQDLAELEEQAGDCESEEDARQRIEEDALSVEVRSGWVSPGDYMAAEEYRIVLCTGGPHVELVGDIGMNGYAESVRVLFQDWFQGRQELILDPSEREAVLEYAACFYFGG